MDLMYALMVDAQVVMVETVQVGEAVVLVPAHRGSFASSHAFRVEVGDENMDAKGALEKTDHDAWVVNIAAYKLRDVLLVPKMTGEQNENLL